MNKILVLGLALLCTSTTFAQKKVNVGVNGGAIGLYDNLTYGGLGLNMTIYNVMLILCYGLVTIRVIPVSTSGTTRALCLSMVAIRYQ